MTWTIKVPKWDKFQHYKDRSPTWIKLYRELSNRRAWRDLSGPAAKLLIDVWMLAAESKDGKIALPAQDIAWRLRLELADMLADLQTLARYELVELASNLGQVASTEERRGETEKEQRNTTTVPPAAAVPAQREPSGHARLMPLIREVFYVPDGKPPEGWDEARDGSILKVLLKGRSADELEYAIRGLRLLVDAPGLWNQDYRFDAARPGEKLTLRALYNTRVGKEMPSFTAAQQAYWRHANYGSRRATSAVREVMG